MKWIFTSTLFMLVFYVSAQRGTIKDIDGNVYHTIKFGSQLWMQENLRTSHYSDGSVIKEAEDTLAWKNEGISQNGAWCYYDNNDSQYPTYGKLYNWYAVTDKHHLCPTGWHVPTREEWQVLVDYISIVDTNGKAGDQMKSKNLWSREFGIGSTTYGISDTLIYNFTGFTALPLGVCGEYGHRGGRGLIAVFWSSTDIFEHHAWSFTLYTNRPDEDYMNMYKEMGYSVRCTND